MASKKGKKGEKNKTPEVVQTEERPAEKEIVPGKGFFERDWAQMLEREEDLRYLCSLVEEIFERSCLVVVHQATEREAYPYSVEWAKDLMVDKVECYFIECDVGETDPSPEGMACLVKDVEPQVPMIDSWARGVVPITEEDTMKETNHAYSESKELEESSDDKVDEETSEVIESYELSLKHPYIPVKPNKHHTEMDKQVMRVISPPTHENRPIEESISATSHTPFSSTAFINIPPLMSGMDSKLRPPHKYSQVLMDEHDRIIKTVRLDSRKFPSPSTKPVVTLQRSESFQTQTRNFNSKKVIDLKCSVRKKLPPKNTSESSRIVKHKGTVIGGMNRVENNRVPREPTLPTFLDIIDPLPGVTVYENGQSLTGHISPRSKLWSPGSRLQPITPIDKKSIKKLEPRKSRKNNPVKLVVPSPLDDNSKPTYPRANVT